MKKELTQKEFATLGGNTILKKYGNEYFKDLSRKGKLSRARNKKLKEKTAGKKLSTGK